ncbi:hypothetical protein H1D31_01510 [Alishewanella sp. BS5-314]|uniref:fimbrial protein n=1 Tax=Alishewanella sp. BS5-314 TaxID=2755587 RepID=UPI0021BA4E2A|nr:fimbrial protein [Alishewanella sp. BS5-314]MCT8124714.1 hypothetical protein [Alishewanella sp. BS5-314]
MIKRKPNIGRKEDSGSKKPAGKAKEKPKKKIQNKNTSTNTESESSSIRSQYINYLNNPDAVIDKKSISSHMKIFDNKDVNFQALLLSVEMTESFRQFDCDTMKDFIDDYLEHSYKAAHKILSQAKIAFDAGGADAVGKYTGNALEALKELDSDERKEVFSNVLKSHSDPKSVTRTVITKTMTELGYIDEISPQHKKTKEKISKIHNKIKKSTTRPDFLRNMAEALYENLNKKDIMSIITNLNKIKSAAEG